MSDELEARQQGAAYDNEVNRLRRARLDREQREAERLANEVDTEVDYNGWGER